MELDEFISKTLQSIIKGISDSCEFAEKSGAIVNPILLEQDYDKLNSIWRKDGKDGRRALSKVDFDIAVTTTNEEGNKIGGGIKVQVLNIGASTTNTDSNETSSRIKI